MTELPRVTSVTMAGPAKLNIRWRGRRAMDAVDLSGWIATGGNILAPLADPDVFARAAVGNYGAAVTWDEDEGDLAIDAAHLTLIAQEQKPFDAEALRDWQVSLDLSNNEAADLVGVRLSTWNTYRAGSAVPKPIAMLCRAIGRDPVLMQAHLRPRKTGRPRKEA